MSLYLFISRKPDPTDDEGPQITEQEWRGLVAGDPDLRAPSSTELEPDVPGGIQASDVALTSADGSVAWMSWSDGQVEVKNANQHTLARIAVIAERLAARVVGETGEIFDAQGAHAGFESWSEFY